ncbi:hypothetical protein Pcinc_031295 [Petrolisthes cinctipes]|uniref:Uncharacterized protein n=1 Tax=Petrolisthes cinctipes TaxID=88211 RepID=A0AAE1EWY1_PETCI|nr:hypothetical protein Pcinc_031295 [Petrolisthes cinctipes]
MKYFPRRELKGCWDTPRHLYQHRLSTDATTHAPHTGSLGTTHRPALLCPALPCPALPCPTLPHHMPEPQVWLTWGGNRNHNLSLFPSLSNLGQMCSHATLAISWWLERVLMSLSGGDGVGA